MTIDLLQSKKKLKHPEIRVWCHPHYIGKSGDDYCYVFKGLKLARQFIKKHKEAEKEPLIAYKGEELSESEFRQLYPKVGIKERI